MGDPGKLLILERILKVVREQKLLENVQKTGAILYNGLRCLEKEKPELINSIRGRGTFLAFNAANGKLRDEIINKLKLKGKYLKAKIKSSIISCLN